MQKPRASKYSPSFTLPYGLAQSECSDLAKPVLTFSMQLAPRLRAIEACLELASALESSPPSVWRRAPGTLAPASG
jgi:hypothetical protein